MAYAYAGDPTNYPDDVTLPSDGDDKSAASVDVGFEGLADRTAFLASSRGPDINIDYAQALRPIYISSEFGMLTAPAVLSQSTTAGEAILELELPNQAVLHSITVYLDAAGGHGTMTGVTTPIATVSKLNLLNGSLSTVGGPTSDPSVLATYEAYHSFDVDCADAEIQRGSPKIPTASTTKSRYYVTISGEDGSNFQAGLKIYGVSASFTMSTRDPGAA